MHIRAHHKESLPAHYAGFANLILCRLCRSGPPLLPLNESGVKGLNCTNAARRPPFGDLPQGCYGGFDDAGRRAIDAIHKVGVVHVARFMDEPRTEAEWAAWGYHLHAV